MKVVKNDIVSMDWNADGFIMTKKEGFISAVHQYGDVAVAFRDGKAYTHSDEEEGNISFAGMVKAVKDAVKSKDVDYPFFYDDYIEIFDGRDFNECNVSVLGLDSEVDDIKARLEDLGGYWQVIEEHQ